MPIFCRISTEREFAFVRFSGSVFGPEITEAIECVLLDPDWKPSFVCFIDACDVAELVLVPEDVKRFSRVIRVLQPLVGTSRTAIVAERELVHMAASLYAEQAMEIVVDHEIGVFRSRPSALDWLGLQAEDVALAGTA